jgi:hypothetical protein
MRSSDERSIDEVLVMGEAEERQIQGSLRCATDGEAVRRFGRDDVVASSTVAA